MQLYLWTTPNGYKPLIMLEEIGVEYEAIKVRLNGEQKKPEYLKLNPNGKIPTLVDRDQNGESIVVFESGAILIYLAEKSGKFLPKAKKEYYQVIQWLMFQMGGIGPMSGQLGHFLNAPENIPYAITRYSDETKRLYQVVENALSPGGYIAGDYSIADMALFPWMRNPSFLNLSLKDYPKIEQWIEQISQREAVQRAMNIKFS